MEIQYEGSRGNYLSDSRCTGSHSKLILGPDAYLAATRLHLLSPTGTSNMWDVSADGYARGEGIRVFFMKTLSRALSNGDRIDAIIRETCVNSDGRTKGIALPSADAQAALISTRLQECQTGPFESGGSASIHRSTWD